MRKGWLMVRPMTAARKNCQAVLTPPMASIDTPSTITPVGISQRGPYRSASRPAKGANSPDIQTPTPAASPMLVRDQPVSSTM